MSRELLEKAAKAAGIQVRWYDGEALRVHDKCNGFAGKWNPITDDGDAFRLAVKLWIEVSFEPNCVQVYPPRSLPVDVPRGDDPYAATRLAIVRAAAAIGEAMK